jgi:hypothetical protein
MPRHRETNVETNYRAIQSWYDRHSRKLFARGLWFLGGEPNTLPPAAFEGAFPRVLIARLSGYHDTATGITHSLLYQLAVSVPGVFADLAFLPPPRDEEMMRDAGIPLWTATTTKRPPADFDVLAISNSVVQELLNLPALLEHSGVPLSRDERREKGAPLVLLGGSNSLVTSVLHGRIRESSSVAGLVDAVLVGDGEESFPRALQLIRDHRLLNRDELLRLLAREIPGWYNPDSFVQEWDAEGKLVRVAAAGFVNPEIVSDQVKSSNAANESGATNSFGSATAPQSAKRRLRPGAKGLPAALESSVSSVSTRSPFSTSSSPSPASFLSSLSPATPAAPVAPVTPVSPVVAAARFFDAGNALTFVKGPISYDEDAAGASHLYLSQGCPYFCSFCKESWEQKPYRERSLQALPGRALELKANLGLSELALLCFNVNTLSDLPGLLDALEPDFHRIAIKSQRFDAIVHSPRLLDRQLEAGKRTYTCAMEGISDRLRAYLQKNLTENVLLNGFDVLFRHNVRQMKIFLIVTGLEQAADIAEFESLLAKLNQKMSALKGKPALTFSLAGLYRPPHTPLQFAPAYRLDGEKSPPPVATTPAPNPAAAGSKTVSASIAATSGFPASNGAETAGVSLAQLKVAYTTITRVVEKAGFEVRRSAGPEDAVVSEFLAYADRRFTPVLVQSSIEKGLRYRGSVEQRTLEFWKKALEERCLWPPGHEPKTGITIFPWDDIDSGIDKAFLWKNFQELRLGKELPTCIAPPLGTGTCLGCGACPDPATRAAVTSLQPVARALPPEARDSERPVRLRLTAHVPEKWAPTGNGFLCAALARMMMLGKPEWVRYFLRFEQGLDRCGASGLFWADCFLKPGAPRHEPGDLARMNAFGDGLRVDEIRPAFKGLYEELPGYILQFTAPKAHSVAEISRRLDDLLVRYRLKHQKRWQGDLLTWELHAGHAKKVGFAAVRWPKDSPHLLVTCCGRIEPHFLEKFAANGSVSILPLAPRIAV